MADKKITDPVTGEELHVFTVTVADGREFVVNARDEDSARRIAREQSGVVNAVSVKKGGTKIDAPTFDAGDDAGDDDAS